jgi:3-(3-hydroxy-phenyl)propionate hydroxylase
MTTRSPPIYPYRRSPDQDGETRHHPVIVVGAGPVGMAAAIDLAQHDVKVLLLDDDQTVSIGSRAICYAKRTLEILDRLGCGDAVADRGVSWNVGKVFHKGDLIYQFDLLPEQGHHRPAFVNLQQYHLEEALVRRLGALPKAEARWLNKVTGVVADADGVALRVDTPDGPYSLACDWLIAADGAKSPIRATQGIVFEGQVFHDHFLIVDIRMKSAVPPERRFWFDPPFHPSQSALMHRQADDVWRIDFQLGMDADPEAERKPERILPRLSAMLGDAVQFEIEWASVYTFQCRRMKHFRHNRVLFAGDAAHLVSPFGARGANSGIQDADNLVWKLKLVMEGFAPERLLDSYDCERTIAADENLRCSTRSTDFITPKSAASRTFRDATLALAKHHMFARRFVNSGRLSVPAILADSPLNTADSAPPSAPFKAIVRPGSPAVDAPVRGRGSSWLLDYLRDVFTLMVFGDAVSTHAAAALRGDQIPCRVVQVVGALPSQLVGGIVMIADVSGLLADRYDGQAGTCYLFRPDQHVCARWRSFDLPSVRAAIALATANVARRDEGWGNGRGGAHGQT